MPKTKKHLLPRRAPKKTGRRGVGPKPDDEPRKKPQLLKDAAKQARLPGMEDTAIEEIEAIARQYKAKQSKRIAILKEEVDLKGLLLGELDKHKKQYYYRDGMEVKVTPTSRKVSVRFDVDPQAEDAEEVPDAQFSEVSPSENEEDEEETLGRA